MIVKSFLIVSVTFFNKVCILGVFDVLQNSLPLSVGMISVAYPKERIARFTKSTVEYPLCSL